MALVSEFRIEQVTRGPQGIVAQVPPQTYRSSPGTGLPKREVVSLAAGVFTALSPPAGSRHALIEIPSTGVSLVLKGVSGDTGTPLTPASAFDGSPLRLPLGASPTLGFLNNGASAVLITVSWD